MQEFGRTFALVIEGNLESIGDSNHSCFGFVVVAVVELFQEFGVF